MTLFLIERDPPPVNSSRRNLLIIMNMLFSLNILTALSLSDGIKNHKFKHNGIA